jgi:acyl carrier protein
MSAQHDIESKVRQYIAGNFPVPNPDQLTPDLSLLNTGIIDSTGYLDLFAWLKDEHGIEVDDAEMLPDNFETIRKISEYIQRKGPKGG